MKKIFLSIVALIQVISVLAQSNDLRRPASIGISFFLNDFESGAEIKNDGLGSFLRSGGILRNSRLNAGFALNYLKPLSTHVDFNGTLGGSFVDYPVPNVAPIANDNFLLETTGGLNLKLLADNYWVVPFANVGVGFSKYKSYYAAFAPIGVGLQVNLAEDFFVNLNSQIRVPITERAASHLYHSFTIYTVMGKRKIEAPKVVELPVVEAPKDRDGDGIVDSLDACPDQAGPASLQGCPDRDNDNIADKDDNCPDVPGLAKYKGCPVPDTDKDGINDEEDKCPLVAGIARYMGCPVPDTDKDGVNDEDDKCPNEVGPSSNYGCPIIAPEVIERVNIAARNIFFAFGSDKLLPKSFPSLNNVIKILQDNPTYKVNIEGHTDTVGTAEKNHTLSHERANSVKAYFVSKGIDESRIASEGFGFTRPIATNKTSAGRAKNRRVEMRLRNY